MKAIVGLGNPGRTYEGTRHNIGFKVLDLLSQKWQINYNKNDWNALYGKGQTGSEEVILVKPMTFMNRSGEAIAPLLSWFKLNPEDLIVLCDDIHLPIGQLRLRARGSDGGHNGLKSIITQTGSDLFIRVRLGVNEPPPGFDQADYVLSRFGKADQAPVEEMITNAADAVETIITSGLPTAMNRYNQIK